MPFTTPTQYLALALALIAGWLLGLASHPGGRKWRDRYIAERDAHAATRNEADARIRELEAENARLGRAAPVTAATIAPNAHRANEGDYPPDVDHIGTNG
ncbi:MULTISPECIES: hypothetical protein [unclassified Sphingomonas]|uniref:hypothetical protein n=1 Tax=unclassified Sphingomonas TaxID=196159 RepID=UPI0009290F36|nr:MULTISPECIES: hypothetical protein [unclassified Sphingomonas]MBN8848122.1 hypothetical protein [Sphingomonas sp.]MBS0284966.1 hypothetical protein [Pseudomonadota bacterium]OJV31864.1 MAG: hypothetical protein BGO24_15515 [Sphingomonas sp. 67-36]